MQIRSIGLFVAMALLAGAAVSSAQETAPPAGGAAVEPDAPAKPQTPDAPAKPQTPGAAVERDDQPTAPAAGGEGAAGKKPQTAPKGGSRQMWPLLAMLGGFFLLYLWMTRGKKKEQQRRKEMLEALKKGDKVTTIGGIVGTVMDVKDDEVTVKVDESANVRMKFARWAVRGVGDAAKAENPQQAQKDAGR